MFLDDSIYQAYLEEMEALSNFRASHVTLHRETPIELLEDPDTLRLVESLAFFSARNRTQGFRQIAQIHQVLFRQYFSFLINPLPAMGLLQLQPSLQIPEKLTLPEGTELIAHTYDERKGAFQTLNPANVAPLFLDSFNFFRRIQGGWHLDISYRSPHSQNEDLKEMSFYINHLNSFFGSLQTFFALSRSIESVDVFYDGAQTRKADGVPCEWEFGMAGHRRIFNHPLERIRSYLHFPEQEMFMTLKLPVCSKKWEVVTFSFELNDKWPEQLSLTKSSLSPFVVPIVNLKTSKGEPIECDGTKTSYDILYPNPIDQFSLHTILGVYEVVAGGMKPLKPGILDKRGRTYEVDFLEQKLFLDLPGVFQDPRRVSIEALWVQLWFSDYIDQEFKISLAEGQISGLKPALLQQIRSHEIPAAASDPKFLLRILSLKNQNRLNLNEILFLMSGLKNLDHSYFRIVPPLIKDLKVEQQLDRTGVGPTIRYEFRLKEWDGKNWEIIVFFFHCLNDFLNCWLSNFHVETAVFFPQIKTPLIFKGGREDELSILARDFFLP